VVPRDRFSTFAPCLSALYARTDVPFRLVVVAGGADAATRRYLEDFRAEKCNMRLVLVDRLLMQGEARNLALREMKERFVVLLENDTIVHEHWLGRLLDCMREARAAVVMPLILDQSGRTIHAAGGTFETREVDGVNELHHAIAWQGMNLSSAPLRRMTIDYPENHCILLDRQLLPDDTLFEDVEPFDVDLGLILRKRGLGALMEPRSVATYTPPPPWEVQDIVPFKFRWDGAAWSARNRLFMQKWSVNYDASAKRSTYRRQYIKLGLARWLPTKWTVAIANASVTIVRRTRRVRSARPGRR
jgi:hypothetical protein